MLFILRPDGWYPDRHVAVTVVNGPGANDWPTALRRGYIHTPPAPVLTPIPTAAVRLLDVLRDAAPGAARASGPDRCWRTCAMCASSTCVTLARSTKPSPGPTTRPCRLTKTPALAPGSATPHESQAAGCYADRKPVSATRRRWRHYEKPSGRRPVKAFIDGLTDRCKETVRPSARHCKAGRSAESSQGLRRNGRRLFAESRERYGVVLVVEVGLPIIPAGIDVCVVLLGGTFNCFTQMLTDLDVSVLSDFSNRIAISVHWGEQRANGEDARRH